MSETPARSADPLARVRIPLLDVLRAVAILCMLAAHGVPFLWPTGLSRPSELILGAVNALASPLFGLAMGAAAALVWARPGVGAAWSRRARTDVGRGVVVYAIGMLVVELNTWVAIVLHVLGVLIIIGIPVAALAGASIRRGPEGSALRWILGALTATAFIVAPWLTGTAVPAQDRLPNGTTGGLAELWAALIAGQSYRAVSLLPFFALGALIASTGLLTRPRRLTAFAVPAALILSTGYLIVRTLRPIGISGGWVDQLFDLALVTIALAGTAAVVGFSARAVVQPLADLGAVALSLYVLQLIVLRPLMSWQGWVTSPTLGWLALIALVVVPSLLMIWWRRTIGPGPLERVVALVTGGRQAT